jgi:hypothetical protein
MLVNLSFDAIKLDCAQTKKSDSSLELFSSGIFFKTSLSILKAWEQPQTTMSLLT